MVEEECRLSIKNILPNLKSAFSENPTHEASPYWNDSLHSSNFYITNINPFKNISYLSPECRFWRQEYIGFNGYNIYIHNHRRCRKTRTTPPRTRTTRTIRMVSRDPVARNMLPSRASTRSSFATAGDVSAMILTSRDPRLFRSVLRHSRHAISDHRPLVLLSSSCIFFSIDWFFVLNFTGFF